MFASTEGVEIALGVTAWYLTSFSTLLLNKYLLGTRHIQPNTLAAVQMISTAIYGALKTVSFRALWRTALEIMNGKRGRLGSGKDDSLDDREAGVANDKNFGHGLRCSLDYRKRRGLAQMGFVGGMRFATVVLGLVSLNNVAASFTETIKASAPFFTVLIAYFMLGERTSLAVCLSLVPVAGGLVMVSCSELSFNAIGFGAAVATNVIECVQNVFSKRLLVHEYTASELQFYTSLTALVLQAPLLAFNYQRSHALSVEHLAEPRDAGAFSIDGNVILLLWIDGLLYHAQSVVAYVVMSYLSPVTVSVVNTLKRAILIWISVLVFGNTVTTTAQLGTGVCLFGALWYNIARQPKKPQPDASSAHGGGDPESGRVELASIKQESRHNNESK
jgi:solute carrier family 35 protein E2